MPAKSSDRTAPHYFVDIESDHPLAMGCTVSAIEADIRKKHQLIIMPISLYQKSLLQDSWSDIEKAELDFAIGMFERLFKSYPKIAPMFPSVNSCQELQNMRRKGYLYGHPKKLINVLREALEAMNDANVFYAKMEGIGVVMANVGLDLESVKAICASFNDQIKETLGKDWDYEVLVAWQDMFGLIGRLIYKGYQSKQPQNDDSKLDKKESRTQMYPEQNTGL